MNRYLQEGAVLKNPADKGGKYIIKDIIGTGTTCVVYRADFLSDDGPNTQHLLKEYNPRTIALDRADDYSLYVRNEKDSQTFNEGLDRFKEGINKQAEVRRCSELTNSTSNIQHTFTANRTFYVDMTLMAGETYDKVKEKSLHDLLRRIKAITKVVNNYHQQGLLHLDIKPENIFTLLDTVELVQMFDFDSVIEKDKVISAPTMSYTQNWAAQEQILPYGRKRICEATDLFAIGEMLFYKLMDRHSTSSERYSYASYQFDTASELFKDINPRIFPVLAEILSHTICNVVSQRYQSADILLKKLDEAIDLANPTKPFLQHSLPCKAAFFVGRDSELSEINNRLKQTDKLFVTGMGGMGKSELCKQYAHMHKEEYDAVIFAVCNTDLEAMMLDDSAIPIANMQMFSGEKAEINFDRKYHVLQNLCNERVLLIVDNLNDMQDSRLNDILQLNCKMLITTRCDVADYNYEQFVLGALEDGAHVRALFDHWYPQESPSADENTAVEQILEMYAGHTLAIELIAKQMEASRLKPQKMLKKLTAGGLGDSGKERVVHGTAKANTYDHIRHLFDVSGLSNNQIYILANLSLIPISGIKTEQFHDWCSLEGYDDINILVESGWVQQDTENDLISLHPVIADIMQDILEQDLSVCENMLNSTCDYIRNDFQNATVESRNYFVNLSVFICDRIVRHSEFPFSGLCFVHLCAGAMYRYGNIPKWINYIQRTLHMYHLLSQRIDVYTLQLYTTLAVLYNDLGQLKTAKKYYNRVLKEASIMGEMSNPLIFTVRNNLATLYMDLGEVGQARKLLERVIEDTLAQPDKSLPALATWYDNLGMAYEELEMYSEAVVSFRKAQDILVSAGYHMSEGLAISYGHLGNLYYNTSKFSEAEEYLKKALAVWQESFGDDFIDTAYAHYDLGLLYREKKQYTEAIKHFITSLRTFENVGENLQKDIARVFSALGKTYAEMKDIFLAQDYYQKALTIRRRIFGETHELVQLLKDRLFELNEQTQSS